MHPAEMDELKELRETTEACWSLLDLARLQLHRGVGTKDECDALAAAYREAEGRYRARCREHRKSLRTTARA
jgi:hypothetical protein